MNDLNGHGKRIKIKGTQTPEKYNTSTKRHNALKKTRIQKIFVSKFLFFNPFTSE
jgi:hypothetical protein